MAKRGLSAAGMKRRVVKLHRESIIIDGHNDMLDRRLRDGKPVGLMTRNPRYHSDGTRLREGGMTASLFYVGGNDLEKSLRLIEQTRGEIDEHGDEAVLVLKVGDIRRAHREGKLGVVMIWEGAMALREELDILRLIYRLGVRSIGLTHGQGHEPYALQGSRSYFGYCTAADRESFRRTGKGLTDFGKKAIREMNRLGMLVDVAHINDRAFYETLAVSEKPVGYTHGGVFACCPHSRCLTDDQIRALAGQGGVMGIAFYNKFLDRRKPTVEHIVDQIAYVAELVGVEYVGIGSDFDGLPQGIRPVIRSAERLGQLTEGLIRRGFSDKEIAKILGGNFLSLLRRVLG